jgi:hypothetical protein
VALPGQSPPITIGELNANSSRLITELQHMANVVILVSLVIVLRSPGADYYAIVLAGMVASLGVIASTLPLIEWITGPENARNE